MYRDIYGCRIIIDDDTGAIKDRTDRTCQAGPDGRNETGQDGTMDTDCNALDWTIIYSCGGS